MPDLSFMAIAPVEGFIHMEIITPIEIAGTDTMALLLMVFLKEREN